VRVKASSARKVMWAARRLAHLAVRRKRVLPGKSCMAVGFLPVGSSLA